MARDLVIGNQLVLVPDPNNPADRNAILIYRDDNRVDDLGYLDANAAKRVCPLMERGATFSAEVYWINNDNPDLPKIYLYVFKLTEPASDRRPTRRNAVRYRPQQKRFVAVEVWSSPVA
jgi:hypothetical protein